MASPKGLTFARAWFDHHLQHDPKISDEKFLKAHDSAGSRVIRTGVLPHTTYIGFYGLAFACFELYRQTEDPKARQVCLDIADTILHLAPRDKNGLVAHDHVRFTEFAIPDTAYFVVRALMIAASLESDIGGVFRRQAIHQARLHSEIFLDRKLGLVKTVRLPSGLGETYGAALRDGCYGLSRQPYTTCQKPTRHTPRSSTTSRHWPPGSPAAQGQPGIARPDQRRKHARRNLWNRNVCCRNP